MVICAESFLLMFAGVSAKHTHSHGEAEQLKFLPPWCEPVSFSIALTKYVYVYKFNMEVLHACHQWNETVMFSGFFTYKPQLHYLTEDSGCTSLGSALIGFYSWCNHGAQVETGWEMRWASLKTGEHRESLLLINLTAFLSEQS